MSMPDGWYTNLQPYECCKVCVVDDRVVASFCNLLMKPEQKVGLLVDPSTREWQEKIRGFGWYDPNNHVAPHNQLVFECPVNTGEPDEWEGELELL